MLSPSNPPLQDRPPLDRPNADSPFDLNLSHLTRKAELRHLPGYAFCIDVSRPSCWVAEAFEQHPTLPGAIIVHEHKVVAIISRRIFLERLSQPYGIEVFLKRPLSAFLAVAKLNPPPCLPAETRVAHAVEAAIHRSQADAYEPILVQRSPQQQIYDLSPPLDNHPHPAQQPEPFLVNPFPWILIDFRTLLLAQTRVLALQKKQLKQANHQVKTTQKQLIAQEKMASLGALTAGISHEIRNPLNFINNFAHLSRELLEELQDLLKTTPEPATGEQGNYSSPVTDIMGDLQENLHKIQHHGQRAEQIIQSMLMHSRGGPRSWDMVDVNPMLLSTTTLAYHSMRAKDPSFSLTLEMDLDPQVQPIAVISQDLDRVFLNIVGNACAALYGKWKTQQENYQPILRVTTGQLEQAIEIRIWDNGPGIPEKIKGKIFEPFFTTKPAGEGTGLGLYLSYEIITQQHQGSISFQSQPNQFTEFRITLPQSARNDTLELEDLEEGDDTEVLTWAS